MDRRTVLGLLGLSVLASQVSGCASAGDTGLVISDVGRAPKGDPVRSTLSPFAARLLDAMPAGNVVISPSSIAVVLAMLANGAASTTRTQFEKVLGTAVDAVNVELNALDQRLTALDGQKNTSITFANALWLQSGMTWQKPFLDSLKKWYGTGGRATDFRQNPSNAVAAINTWCKEATKGLIPEIVDTTMITKDTRVVAGNAVHIKGSWKVPFQPSRTAKEPFRTGSGAEVSADTMHGEPYLPYLQTGAMTSIALPFLHEDLAFVVGVPTGSGPLKLAELPDLCDVLDARPTTLELSMPKFRVEFGQSLKASLVGLGLVDAWDGNTADFSGITGDRSLYLAFIQHKAILSVDENGAEGAAVTVSGMSATALPPSFHVDRAFVWAIVHVPTRTLVMLGREDDPTH